MTLRTERNATASKAALLASADNALLAWGVQSTQGTSPTLSSAPLPGPRYPISGAARAKPSRGAFLAGAGRRANSGRQTELGCSFELGQHVVSGLRGEPVLVPGDGSPGLQVLTK